MNEQSLETNQSNIYTQYSSPIGELTIQANSHGLLGAWFETQTTQPAELGRRDDKSPILNMAINQLAEYFNGKRQAFDLPIASRGTDFQQQVWHALCTIPFAKTWSYQELANAINNQKAVRAVGLANGKNPLSIIVPCHRVIGKNGSLTGYAGGLKVKAWLLQHEASVFNEFKLRV